MTDYEGIIGYVLLELQFRKITRKQALLEIMQIIKMRDKETNRNEK